MPEMSQSEIDAITAQIRAKAVELEGVNQQIAEDMAGNRLYYFGRKGSSLQPNPLQERLLNAWMKPEYKIFCYTGANRIGKTALGSIIAHLTLFGKLPWDDTDLSYLFPHNKPRKVRYIGQDWQSHIKGVVIPALKEWWPKDRKVKTKGNGILTDTDWTDVESGSTLKVMSNLQDSDLHEGEFVDLVIFDEPPKRDIWIANARGLVDRQGRALFNMTLLKEAWVHTDIIKRMNPDGSPDRSVFAVDGDIYVNVGYGITKEGVDEFAKNLTEDEKQARLKGKPSYLSGLVCKNFDRHKHIVERFDIPTNWIVDIAIDTHPRKEHAVLYTAVSPQQNKYCCFEIWKHGSGTDVGDWIARIVNRNALRVGRVIIDPLAKGDSNNPNTTYDKIAMVLARHNMVVETATKDKGSGIIEINNHLKGPNNEPSLFFFNDLRICNKQVENWMYDDKGENEGKPSKKDDDMCENLYRTLLLDTEYYPPEYDGGDDEPDERDIDEETGY
jgi:hypothetical protein